MVWPEIANFPSGSLQLLTYLCNSVGMSKKRPHITVLAGAMRHIRKAAGLSQEGVAGVVDVTPGMIALIETGRRQPSEALLARIAECLSCEPEALAFIEPAADSAATESAA